LHHCTKGCHHRSAAMLDFSSTKVAESGLIALLAKPCRVKEA